MKSESKYSEKAANRQAPLNGAKSGLESEFYTILADIEYLIKDAAQLTGDDLTRTTIKISEHIATARKNAEAMGDTFAERAQQTITTTSNYVQRQPWKAIGISAGVGIVLGMMFAGR